MNNNKKKLLTPTSSTNILSRPTGPREVLTILATDRAAITEKKIENNFWMHSIIVVLTILAANTLARRSFPSNKQLCCSRHLFAVDFHVFQLLITRDHVPHTCTYVHVHVHVDMYVYVQSCK